MHTEIRIAQVLKVQVSKLYMNSVLCNVTIVFTVAIISNAVARWRAMHVSRLQNVRSIH